MVYLVRSLELVLELSSHDWHVQPYCQRPNCFPPQGRTFSPERNDTNGRPSVLETLQTYRVLLDGVNLLSSQDFHLFSTTAALPQPNTRNQVSAGTLGLLRTARRIFRSQNGPANSAQAEAEEFKLEKRSFAGF